MKRVILVPTTSLVLGSLIALWSLVTSGQDTNTPAGPGEEDEVTCYYRVVCLETEGMTEVETEHRLSGIGEDEPQAYANALVDANEVRDECIANGGEVTYFEQDGCDPPQEKKPQLAAAAAILAQYSCVARDGTQLKQIHYGDSELEGQLLEAAWNDLLKQATTRGGIAPGTQQAAIDNKYEYRAAIRLQSIEDSAQVHREFLVEGSGASAGEAERLAEHTEQRVISEASASELVTRLGSIESKKRLRLYAGQRRTRSPCVLRCTTNSGWIVFVSIYASTVDKAWTAGEKRARKIAEDLYSFAVTCTPIEPQQLP